jgi:hypothetical protein
VSHARARSLRAAQERLAEADARLGEPWLSLGPDRTHASSLVAIGRAVLESTAGVPHVANAPEAFADALAALALAMRDAFPHNAFGDLDHLAACLWRDAGAAPAGPLVFLEQQHARLVELQHLFGRATPIRFRYAHDFLYGFDWAKWVARDPAPRGGVGPFSSVFLQHMQGRGHELLAVIAKGHDRRYPPLPDGRPRNAFGFSREHADELALHRQLARAGLLPVEAWRIDASPRWDRPFAQLRREHAARLGLAHDPARAAPDGLA